MNRGRPKEIQSDHKPIKFIRIYDDDEITETWKYDLNKFRNGPTEVDIRYKAGAEKAMKLRAKETKQSKQITRQMKKIEENRKLKTGKSKL